MPATTVGRLTEAIDQNFSNMADKFPEINDVDVGGETPSGDFLSREKQVVGDEFATAGEGKEDDEEFEEFKSEYPEIEGDAADAGKVEAAAGKTDAGENAAAPSAAAPSAGAAEISSAPRSLADSEPVQQWKEKWTADIAERDASSAEKVETLKADAVKSTDEFYDKYGKSKEESIKSTKEQEKKFLQDRDSFLEKGTVWDRAVKLLQLTKNSSSVDDAGYRDKTRFKEILLGLQGKEDAPGAQGVSESK